MRRPLLLLPAGLITGIGLGYALSTGMAFSNLPMVLFFMGLLMLIIGLFFPLLNCGKNLTLVFLSFFLFGLILFFSENSKYESLLSIQGQASEITGTVLSIEEREGERYRMIVSGTVPEYGSTTHEKRVYKNSKFLVNVKGDPVSRLEEYDSPAELVGQRIYFSCVVQKPQGQRNPKCFDYALYLRSMGVSLITTVEPRSLQLCSDVERGLPGFLFQILHKTAMLRQGFTEKLMNNIGSDNTALVMGMLFGDKNFLSEEVYEAFQKNGTAHILSVSGIHIGLLYAFVNQLMGKRRQLRFQIAAGIFLIFYGILSAFAPSVVRAIGMIFMHMAAKLLHKRYDFISSAAIILSLTLILNPMNLFHIGFQLSYLAIFSIAVLLPLFLKFWNHFLMPGIVIQLGMIPITAYIFNYFSWAAFLINLPVIFLSAFIIPIGVLMLPLSCFDGGFASGFFMFGSIYLDILCKILLFLNNLAYIPGVSFFYVISPNLFLIVFFYTGVFFCCSETGILLIIRKNWKQLFSIVLCFLILSLMTAFAFGDLKKQPDIVFVDVGQGDCIHIRTAGGKDILIDGGGNTNYDVGKKILLPYLLKNGVKNVDLVFVSHLDWDHYGGLTYLARELQVGRFFLFQGNCTLEDIILEETGLKKETLQYLKRGDKLLIDKQTHIEVLYPGKGKMAEVNFNTDFEGEKGAQNEMSLVLKIYMGKISLLTTGDIGITEEEELLDNPLGRDVLSCNILKVPHHGSRYSNSPDFVKAAEPDVAVFQVGKNNFGHPSGEVLARYDDAGARIYRNDRQGAILIYIRGKSLSVETME